MQYLHLDEEQSVDLIKSTVRLAQLARDKFLTEVPDCKSFPLIAASIGPYGAHLHDGSEYTGTYADYISKETLQKWHRIRIDACLDAGTVDCLAIETIPCALEMEALVELLAAEYPDVKYWLSFQCRNQLEIAHGESFAATCLDLWHNRIVNKQNVMAIGVNCINPRHVTPLLRSVNGDRAEKDRLPMIVYPNSGEVYDVQGGWSGKEDCVPLEQYAPEWIGLGVRYLGGCCRTNARDIERIKVTIDSL